MQCKEKGESMQITIDLLSLALGFMLGVCAMGAIYAKLYFDDKWDSAFAIGWKCGSDYEQKKGETV